MRLWSGMLHSAGSHAAGSLTTHIAFGEQRAFNPWYCTPRWLPAVVNEAVFSGVSMAAEKTFSRINAGKSMLFLDRSIRCGCYVWWTTCLWAGGIALRDGSLRSALFAAHNTPSPKALQPQVVPPYDWNSGRRNVQPEYSDEGV